MKFVILAFAAFFAKLAAADDVAVAGALDLKTLGFALYGRHVPAGTSVDKTKCPLGTLPANVFLHKTVKHNGANFTWVKPVHALVNELVCGSHAVWKGAAEEFLVDLHFFGNVKGKMFVHLEHVTALGAVAHAFLRFEKSALEGKVLGLAPFVAGVAGLLGAGFLDVNALPAHELLHHLAHHFAAL
ncbi:hypothetical protein MACJ_004070 [Theileria orientalis]|uniref:Uncharacterized protein n=1 Tax=Theileria orientalis TaxID=68886 RepID=A0A976SL86_THEOR|nr:hypothetical protein MACJ_004068 [Theileria orientalis]UVC54520.1 hypothetical protein MACJ_004070 [Theileria orientalis]